MLINSVNFYQLNKWFGLAVLSILVWINKSCVLFKNLICLFDIIITYLHNTYMIKFTIQNIRYLKHLVLEW